jgi:carbamoyl-phosphate synthase large subunit
MRILMTGAAGPAGRALLRLLDPTVHDILAVDMAPIPPADLPAGVATATVPAAADPAMLPALVALVREHAAEEGRFLPARTAISDASSVGICHDKYLTALALTAAGVAVPEFALPGQFEDTRAALAALGAPLIVKPRVGRGGRGVVVVESPEDLDWAGLDDSWIVQEMAPGIEYAPMVHRSSVARSRAVVLEKTGLKQGRVGNATGVRRLADGAAEDVAALARDAADALGLTGTVDMDVRRTADGSPVVLEINARFGANSAEAPKLLEAVLAEAAVEQRTPAPAREHAPARAEEPVLDGAAR